jgi:hypothetical protein
MFFKRYRELAQEAFGKAEDICALAQGEFREEVRERVGVLPALAGGVLAGLLACGFACAALLIVAWDTPYRIPVALGLPLALGGLAGVLLGMARTRWRRRKEFFNLTRVELRESYWWLKHRL